MTQHASPRPATQTVDGISGSSLPLQQGVPPLTVAQTAAGNAPERAAVTFSVVIYDEEKTDRR